MNGLSWSTASSTGAPLLTSGKSTAQRPPGQPRQTRNFTALVLADRAYQGVGPWVTTGLKRPPGGERTPTQRTVNRALTQARAPVERGRAQLKSWRTFRKSRISPNRMTSIAKALLTLERQR